jgi:hypothetical protein
MSHDVFVSYSKLDKPTADALCATLESRGIRCWIAPRDVMPGVDWGEAIVKAIGGCRVMVLVFSSHANESNQVRREVQRAFEKGLTVIPLRVEDVVPVESLEYYIGPVHWLDAITPPLERHLQALAGQVQLLVGASNQQPAEQRPDSPSGRSEPRTQPGLCVSDSGQQAIERAQRVVRPPAILMIGFAALLIVIYVAMMFSMPADSKTSGVMIVLSVLIGAAAIAIGAGVNMLYLRRYHSVIFGSVAVAVASSVFCIIGVAIAVWVMIVLMRPEVIAQFNRE